MAPPVWTIPALPLLGFLTLALARPRRPGLVGCAAAGGAALLALWSLAAFFAAPPAGAAAAERLWTWMDVAGLDVGVGLRMDALALVMTLVVTLVGFLIHVYSTGFMAGDEGVRRFFAYLNLFLASMLVLVLADDLVLLYLGWEGVGLCSFLLIGFWYRDPATVRAARKAFLVTRVGDAAMALGLFLLFDRLGTLHVPALLDRVGSLSDGEAAAAAALLLAGAVGKSAQIPLQTWLPDAMAGPTPVSALIHAATMVTAGVYLVARVHPLFEAAPAVQTAVALVGAATLLLGSLSALVQRDLKRALAYSTMSQLGYMFLALGAGAYWAAIFHLAAHACFKALLFLAAGAVILATHHEHDVFRMGGLRRKLPVVFWTFTVGAAALAGFPLTAGFFSKDAILAQVWAARGPWLWAAGTAGALVTAVYAFRLVFVVFFGEGATRDVHRPPPAMLRPLVVLAALSVLVGFLEVPLGAFPAFSGFLRTALPDAAHPPHGVELALLGVAAVVSVVGIAVAWRWFRTERRWDLALGGFGFDRAYDALVARPVAALARALRDDPFDAVARGPAAAGAWGHAMSARAQTGRYRLYAAVAAAGAVLFLAIAVLVA